LGEDAAFSQSDAALIDVRFAEALSRISQISFSPFYLILERF